MRKLTLIAVALIAFPLFAQTTAQEWFNLGVQRNDARDYKGALEALNKAKEAGFAARPLLNQQMLRAYAQTGEKEKAFTLLQAMANNGFGPATRLNAIDDLVPLRSDPRWKKIIEQMENNAHPCKLSPEYRQFDYWLGEWDVEIAGQKLASSSVQIVLDDCVVFENYTDSRGYAGKSFSIYDATTKKWEQRYVDTTGGFHTWTGGIEDGRMVFYWKNPQGLNKMTYEKEGPDRVRQLLFSSNDEGKTWQPTYNGLYIRRK